ncbi:MAG: serine/threonine-protein kinase [Enhygromyxa sp.]
MEHGTSSLEAPAEAQGSGDPMASIRPELPASPPLVAATVELSSWGERDDNPTVEPAGYDPVSERAYETHRSGPFLIPVREPKAASSLADDDAPYELIELIGEGGMGEVWQARQRALGRVVALKRVREGKRGAQAIVRQFESEARLTGILDHPNIVTVHELGRDQVGRVFYTMKLIQGTAWSEVIASNRRKTGDGEIVELELRDHLEILLEVSQAIAFAHSRGVIHRDIKPGNVMIGDYGEVLVVDWGLAVALRPLPTLGGAETWTLADLPRSALVCGTPAYMSPETARAERERIGLATDVYLLGAVLFHVLYGRPPHKAKSVQEVISKARVNGWSFPTTALPRKHEPWDVLLRPVITRALATDPQQRYADAGSFGEALREALRNYDSAKLATRAQQKLAAMDLHELSADGGYKAIAAIIAQLEGALESWPRNLAARRALGQAHLELASLALANDDLKLAKLSVDAYERLPPLPERGPERLADRRRRVTLHPVDATLIGAPRPSDSLIAAGTSNAWLNSVSDAPLPGAAPTELARTVGALELAARRSAARPSGTASTIAPRVPPGASASVDIQQDPSDTLLDDEAVLADRAERLRDGVREQELEIQSRRRAVKIALSLAASLAIALIVALTVGGLALQRARDQARQERNQLSQVLLDETANTTEAELELLFRPVHGALLTAVAWAEAGELEADDPRELNARFMPLLRNLDAATSMLRADAAGYEYMLLRTDEGWRTRSTHPELERPQLDEWSETGEHLRRSEYERPYNPHERPWYKGGAGLLGRALEAKRAGDPPPVHWTAPYTFFTTREVGISVSAPAPSSSGRRFVIAFDLKLGDISTFTRQLPVGIEQGQVFVLDEHHQVLGLPRETRGLTRSEEEQVMLTPMADLRVAPVSRQAFLGWRQRRYTTEPFRLEFGPDQVYWVGFRRVAAGDRPKMWIGVVVPESHFLME